MKKCSSCKKEKEATEFYRCKKNNDGLQNTCKTCKAEYQKKHREENPERTRENDRMYHHNNKTKKNKRHNEYRQENIDAIRAADRKYYHDNKERISEKRRQNLINISEQKKIYYAKNRERIKVVSSKWAKNNTEKKKISRHKRIAAEKELAHELNSKTWESIREHFNNKCAYCGKEARLTQDHFVALTRGGEYTINNIVPACGSCNSSKGTKSFFEWYPSQPLYNKARERKILKFLNYVDGHQQLSFCTEEVKKIV